MTFINISTNRGVFRNLEIDKPFVDITIKDVRILLNTHMGSSAGVNILGWANVTHKQKGGK